jgi:hypothetical protein
MMAEYSKMTSLSLSIDFITYNKLDYILSFATSDFDPFFPQSYFCTGQFSEIIFLINLQEIISDLENVQR